LYLFISIKKNINTIIAVFINVVMLLNLKYTGILYRIYLIPCTDVQKFYDLLDYLKINLKIDVNITEIVNQFVGQKVNVILNFMT